MRILNHLLFGFLYFLVIADTLFPQQRVSYVSKKEVRSSPMPASGSIHLTFLKMKVDREVLDLIRNDLHRVSALILDNVDIGTKEATDLLQGVQDSLGELMFIGTKPQLDKRSKVHFPILTKLSVCGSDISDDFQGIMNAGVCPELCELEIINCRLTPLRIRNMQNWSVLPQLRSFVLRGDVSDASKDNSALMLVQKLDPNRIITIKLQSLHFELNPNKSYDARFPALSNQISAPDDSHIDWKKYQKLQNLELYFATEDTAGLQKLLSDEALRNIPNFVAPYPVMAIEYDAAFYHDYKYLVEDQASIRGYLKSYFKTQLVSRMERMPFREIAEVDVYLNSTQAANASEITLQGPTWHSFVVRRILESDQMPKLQTVRLYQSPMLQRDLQDLMDQYPDLHFDISFYSVTTGQYWPQLAR